MNSDNIISALLLTAWLAFTYYLWRDAKNFIKILSHIKTEAQYDEWVRSGGRAQCMKAFGTFKYLRDQKRKNSKVM